MTRVDGQTALEASYRRALRLLPRSYREQWEEDMVSTFLATTMPSDPEDAEIVGLQRPSTAELMSVLGLAIRLRLGSPDGPARPYLWAQALRLVALSGLFVSAVSSTWVWYAVARSPSWDDQAVSLSGQWGELAFLAEVAEGLLWVLAFFALALGYRRVAQVSGPLALLLLLATRQWDYLIENPQNLLFTIPFLLIQAIPVVCLVAYTVEVPRPRHSIPAYVYAVGGLAALSELVVLVKSPLMAIFLVDTVGISCLLFLVAAVTQLVRPTLGHERIPAWSLTLGLLGPVVLALRLLTADGYLSLLRYTEVSEASRYLLWGLGFQVVITTAVTIPLLVLARRVTRFEAPVRRTALEGR